MTEMVEIRRKYLISEGYWLLKDGCGIFRMAGSSRYYSFWTTSKGIYSLFSYQQWKSLKTEQFQPTESSNVIWVV